MYQSEAAQRASWYAVPYYGDMYYDGTYGDWPPGTWEAKIVNRMNKPSPITLTIWGSYNSGTNTGTIYAKFRNDSTATIAGNVYFAITEDSIYYAAPNGDNWHNHVARDYVPNANGTAVSIAAGDSTTQSQAFTINGAWNENRCQIVTWIQNTSTKNVFQSGMKDVMALIGIEELTPIQPDKSSVKLVSNPCADIARFSIRAPFGNDYRINVFDAAGRKINTLSGIATGDQETVTWDLRNDNGSRVTSGVYFYRFDSARLKTSGKIVVK